jgi:hypothetical protein
MATPSKNIGRGRQPTENPQSRKADVCALEVLQDGQLRPLTYYAGGRTGDVRWIAGRFLVSLQLAWDQYGDDVLGVLPRPIPSYC